MVLFRVKPGQPTADYIGTIMDRITFAWCYFTGNLLYITRFMSIGICRYAAKSFSTFFEAHLC